MSLVQHVTAQEGFDNEYSEADSVSIQLGRPRSVSITYDPTPLGTLAPSEKLDPIGAYEVSHHQRLAQVIVGVISCVLCSGIVFGYAALKSVLVSEDIYRDSCSQDEIQANVPLCYLQDQRLNLTFIIASITTNLSALPVGALLDRYGPRVCGIVGSALLFLGSVCMAFEEELPFDALILAQFLLAFGGTFVFVPSFHLSNAFPQQQGIILALVTGAFDVSAAVFLVLRLLYNRTNGSSGLKRFFLLYLAVPVLLLICQTTMMPARSYETRTALSEKIEEAQDPAQDVHDSDDELADGDLWKVISERYEERQQAVEGIVELLGTEAERNEYMEQQEEMRAISGVWGVLHGRSAWEQIRSPWFTLLALLTILTMARMNFFIATIWSQYNFMLDSSMLADRVTEFFDIALPLGGVVAVPFVGCLLDRTSAGVVLSLLVGVSTVIGVLGVFPKLWAAYGNVILFVLFRPLYYSAMSDYAAKVFGFTTFGTVYGAIISISGLCTFFQSALQALVHDVFLDDPRPVNMGMTMMGLAVGIALVMFVDSSVRALRKAQGWKPPGVRQPLLQSTSLRRRPQFSRMSTLREAPAEESSVDTDE